jgi:hypothetical protein
VFKKVIINTHKILSAVIYDKVQENTNFYLEYKYFLWGNIQPDIVPGLVLKSHYKAESLDYVIKEIVKLSKTPPSLFQNKQVRNKFSEHMGIISHFLCDFFCLPHYSRWHYNSSMMLPHIKFEKSLNRVANNLLTIPNLSLLPISNFDNNILESFIETVLREYSLHEDYRNDLIFASNICAEIIEKIISLIFNTTKAQTYAQIA